VSLTFKENTIWNILQIIYYTYEQGSKILSWNFEKGENAEWSYAQYWPQETVSPTILSAHLYKL